MKKGNRETGLLFILAGLSLVSFFYIRSVKTDIDKSVVIEKQIADQEESLKPILGLVLNAKAFAIYDMDKKEFFYKKNAEVPMSLASLAKIMSSVVVMENSPKEHIFKISKESLSEAGDNKLLVDEKWGRDALLKFALVESSNDAFHEMAQEVGAMIDPDSKNPTETFISKMNKKAEELNLRSANFKNPTGLDVSEHEAGAFASARDVAKLFAYAYENYPDIFSETIKNSPEISSENSLHTAKNTNPVAEEIPGLLASKTGFTSISGGNLAVIIKGDDGDRLVVVVLGSTFDERFRDVEKISGALSKSTND